MKVAQVASMVVVLVKHGKKAFHLIMIQLVNGYPHIFQLALLMHMALSLSKPLMMVHGHVMVVFLS